MAFDRGAVSYGKVSIGSLELESGKVISPVVQAYSIQGEARHDGSNVVLVCHALTGSHHVSGPDVEGLPGAWWDPIVGPGKAIDTSRFCAVCFNVLGSCYGSTGPASLDPSTGRPYAMSFPIISVRDMVKAQREALRSLGIDRIALVIGGSLGGMQALEWACSYPEMVERAVVIAAPARLYPQAIAFNEVQRKAITSDPDWKGGDYYPERGPVRGLAVARMLGMITYRSEMCFASRWMREAVGDVFDWNGKFKVESYLHHHGEELVRRFDANCYLYLTKAMDLHDVSRGRGSLEEALGRMRGPLLGVGISSDMLFPNWQVEEITRAASRAGVKATYEEITSDNGHDAFLIDFDQLDEILRDFLHDSGMR